MKILMLSSEFYPIITGGLGIVCYSIAKNLVRHGVGVSLLLPSSNPVYFAFESADEVDKMEPILINSDKILLNELRVRKDIFDRLSFVGITLGKYDYPELNYDDEVIYKIATTIPFDLIHANDWTTVRLALKIKRISKKPFLFHIHSTEFDRACGYGNPFIHSIELMGLQNADFIITVSMATANVISNRYGIDPSKIQVIYNAFDTSTFPEIDFEEGSGLIQHPVIVFVGRLTPQKGPFYFLEVAKKIISINENFRFVIAGDGELKRDIERLVIGMNLDRYVTITGFLSRERLALLFSKSQVLLLPSVYEPFGIVALEAMSFGVVPIVSENSGILEIVKWLPSFDYWDINSMAFFLIKLFNKMRIFKRYRKKSLRAVRNNLWRSKINELLKVYKKLN